MRPRLVVVSADARLRESLERELSKRYAADYGVLSYAGADEVPAADDEPVALLLAGFGAADPDGLALLAELGAVHRSALRVAVVRWGDWTTAEPVFEAVTVGGIDRWLTAPQETPDEEFHSRITEYLGQEDRTRRSGTIPGSTYLEWTHGIDAVGAIADAEAVRANFVAHGITPDKEIIPFCGGGYRSAHTYLLLKGLGYPRVRNYLGSWGEWGNREDTPIVIPEGE